MSRKALHDTNTTNNQDPAGTAGAVEVLMRLPDVRGGGSRPTPRSVAAVDRGAAKSRPNASNGLGALFDSLRQKCSTWKNAAMFAQVGISSRLVVVGGLVVGMVVAAYVLVDRKGDSEPSNYDRYRASRDQQAPRQTDPKTPGEPLPAAPTSSDEGARLVNSSPAGQDVPPTGKADWTPVEQPAASTARMPRARLELDPSSDAVPPRRTVDRRAIAQPPVRSADARSGIQYDAQRQRAEQFDHNTSTFRPTDQSPDPYAPTRGQAGQGDATYVPRIDEASRTGAGFRGTIEPVPYRN